MKQTAVEWLFKNIWTNPPENLLEILEKAKEMEKQNIIDAYWEGCSNWDSEKEAEQYYNETFNK